MLLGGFYMLEQFACVPLKVRELLKTNLNYKYNPVIPFRAVKSNNYLVSTFDVAPITGKNTFQFVQQTETIQFGQTAISVMSMVFLDFEQTY